MSQEALIIAACVTGGSLLVISLSKLAYVVRHSGWFSPLMVEERNFGPMVLLLDGSSAHLDLAGSDRRRRKLLRMAVEDARLVQASISRGAHFSLLRGAGECDRFLKSC